MCKCIIKFLKEVKKGVECKALMSIFLAFSHQLGKFSDTGACKRDSIYHMMESTHIIFEFCMYMSIF